MFRKLIVVLCLVSFCPAAVGAQGMVPVTTPPAAVVSVTENATSPSRVINLSLPAERVLMAAADTSEGAVTKAPTEQKRESRSSFNWSNFAEVHLGDYRWVWWVGAAAVLVAIHAGAD